MYQIDFRHPVAVHFIGIGGISMSGLAEVLHQQGFRVSGSDSVRSSLTDSLEQKGIHVMYRQAASHISEDIQLVVYTAAVHADNPELVRAKELNIPLLTRAELLGQLMRNYNTAVAVAGTHGKTTTTSMISQILLEADRDPTISVGGILPVIGGNIRVGRSDLFITEACEYTNSFLNFFPTISVILNMDSDHLDFFKDIEDIRRSFRKFAELLPADGSLVINSDTPHWEEIARDLPCRVVTVSLEGNADYTAGNITFDKYGRPSFDVYERGVCLGAFYLKIPGIHNVGNALASLAVSRLLDIPVEAARKGLAAFTGTQRRFEYKGEVGKVTMIDDYAHHPTEITATLKAAQAIPHHTLWCVFQPHTYSRTKSLLDEFAEALSLADQVVLAKIYAARETDDLGVSSALLQEKLQELGIPCEYFDTFDEIEAWLLSHCEPGDVVITMGAGDIFKVGEHLLGSR